MALKSKFNESRVTQDIQRQTDTLYEKILNSFIIAGEEFVTNARGQMQDHAMGQYKDQTTNLRNSIGYFVYHNGELIKENLVGNAVANKQAIQDIINPKGFQLIGIAGMNYASHVESKGYNVISYQADICMVDLAGYLEKLEVIEQGTSAQMEETFIP
uniref:Uncharacterized protein n=1 Tax=viral metagenome TaxID=1070528 RepID=A0A6M3XQR0_9ZZZZ